MGSSNKGPMPFYQKVLLGAFGGQSDHTHILQFALGVNNATLVVSSAERMPISSACVWTVLKGESSLHPLVAMFCLCYNDLFSELVLKIEPVCRGLN